MKNTLTLQQLQEGVEFNLQRDGFLVPVIFICNEAGAKLVDISDAMQSDDAKDKMVKIVSEFARKSNAYKIMIVSEGWNYSIPDGITDGDLKQMCDDGSYREKLSRTELYQIVEVTADSVQSIARNFHRIEDVIILDDMQDTSNVELVRFKPLQDCLKKVV